MNRETILHEIEAADMVLIGLGEEFNNKRTVREREQYQKMYEKLEKSAYPWLIPALNTCEIDSSSLVSALNTFAEKISKKNYFVVSTSTNPAIRSVNWKEHRLVMPCGDCSSTQCGNNCSDELWSVSDAQIKSIIRAAADAPVLDAGFEKSIELILGNCPHCKTTKVLNNVYANPYNENGYSKQWELYTKWLTGSMNKSLLILELGVGMNYPTVIRYPFERVAYINQKARYFRVNERLSMLSEELAEKGVSIAENAIDWIESLC